VGAHDEPDPAVADLAVAAGVEVRMVPAIGDAPAGHPDDAERAVARGAAVADSEVDGGTDLLLLASDRPPSDVGASALVGLLAGSDAAAVTSRGTRIDDAAWMSRAAAVRDAMRAARPVMADQVKLLAAVGSEAASVATGLLVQAAARRTPVVLDGGHCVAAALVAQRVAFRSVDWWQVASADPEPGTRPALDRLGLRPVLDLAMRREDGTGALLAAGLVRAAVAHLAAVSDR
jgi:nicotinate-nucleotide--dimethylbenzimidazole phosphoribosyltransferase